MRRALVIALLCVVLVLSLPLAALWWLCYTESGLRWAVSQTSRLKSMELDIEGLQGRLAGTVTADRIVLKHPRIDVEATQVRASLRLRALLLQTVQLDDVRVDSVAVALKPRTAAPSERAPAFLPVRWLAVQTTDVQVNAARVTLQSGQQLLARDFRGDTRVTRGRVNVRNIHVPVFTYVAAGQTEADGPRLALTGEAALRAADPTGLEGQLQWTAHLEGQPEYAGHMTVGGDLESMTFTGAVLQPLEASIEGRLADLTTNWNWDAQVDAPAFNLKPWSPESGLGNFQLALRTRGNQDSLHVSGRVTPDTFPTGPMDVSFDGAWLDRALRTDRLQLLLTNGTQVRAAGRVGFPGGMPLLDLRGQWTRFAWPLTQPAVRSRQGEFTLSGQMPYAFTARGDLSSGQLPAVTFDGAGSLSQEAVNIDAVTVRLQETAAGSLVASGRLRLDERQTWQAAVEAREVDPAVFAPDFPGKVTLQLMAHGQGFKPEGPWEVELTELSGHVRKQPLSGEALIKHRASVWDIGHARVQAGSAQLDISGSYDQRSDSRPDVRWRFSAEDLSLLLPEARGQVQFSGQLGGTQTAPRLTASLQAAQFEYGGYSAAALQAEADLDLKEELSAELDAEDAGEVRLQASGSGLRFAGQTFESVEVNLGGNTSAHQLKTQARSGQRRLQLAIGGVYTQEQWQGRLETLDVVTPEATLALEKPVDVFVGRTRVSLDPFCLSHPPQRICGWMKAEGPEGSKWPALDLSGALQAQTRELGFITALVPEIDRASGDLNADIKLSGTLGAPQIEGVLALEKGEMDLFLVNLMLREMEMRLEMRGKMLSLNGQARAGQGSFQVDGKLEWESGAPFGNLDLKGENLLITNVPEARIHASPRISVGIQGREVQVDGAVTVPYARLAPANLSGAMLPSADEVIVGTPPADPDKSFRVTTGILLVLGDDVRIESYGLSGKLTGKITSFTSPDEPGTASGELSVEEGEYSAYGRELEIERGRLIFTGGLVSNPGVDIRATRKFPEVLAGINVRGTLRDPRLSFFSEPPMTQTQIASMIVAGRTFDSMQDGSGPGFGREQLLAQGGALLARQLGGQIGLDDVTVESGANDDTSLVLGKYLSPRLYVGYGISLAESINTLKLRYTLGDRWTIKLEAGENRAADVVYAIDR